MTYKSGERIKRIREQLNMKQKDFAKMLGISPPTLSELEIGNSKPTFDVLVKLTSLFHINAYYVLFGKGDIFENPLLEFFINLEENDITLKTDHVRKFLEYFGKSRQLQYHIMNSFEKKMLDDGDSILKEVRGAGNRDGERSENST